MTGLLALPVALPLLAAAVTTVVRRPAAQRAISFMTMAAVLAYSASLVVATFGGRVLATQVGGWPAPFAIPLVADPLAALMLTAGSLMVLVCTVFATARHEDERILFHPLVLFLQAGLGGAFLTADLFNLFVFFEVMLIASYVLLTLGGSREQVRGGAVYVTTNLLGSTILIAGVALVYGETGTVNMAELAVRVRTTGTIAVAGTLLLVAFAVKSAMVPVHGWLPRSYPAASPAVSALFSGLLTKVGVYAIFRLYAVVFGGDVRFRTLLAVLAGLTMAIGVLGAVGRDGMRDILSFHMVSQVGYILMGLAIFGPLGLAAGIFYMVQYIGVKTGLFLAAGAVETVRGTGSLSRLGGLARTHPILATGFMVCALSLSGIPPLSGFFGKVILVHAAFDAAFYALGATAVVVSLFTLQSMVKIWNGAFWGEPVSEGPHPVIAGGAPLARETEFLGSAMTPAGIVAPLIVLSVLTVALGLGAEGLYVLSRNAADVLLDPTAYLEAVLGR